MPRLRKSSQIMRLIALAILASLAIGLAYLAYAKSRVVPDSAGEQLAPTTRPTAAPQSSPTPPPQEDDPETGAGPGSEGARVVVLGDRYSQDPGWVQILSEEHGWETLNLSEDGMGYMATPAQFSNAPCTPFRGQVDRVAEFDPEIVILAGGEADGDYALAEFAEPTVSQLQDALPEARIVILTPMSAESPWPYWLMMHIQSLRATAVGTGVEYLDASSIVGVASAYEQGALTPEAQSALATLVAESEG